jgi:hypothetical protein
MLPYSMVLSVTLDTMGRDPEVASILMAVFWDRWNVLWVMRADEL